MIAFRDYAIAFAGDVVTDAGIDDVILDPVGTIWGNLFYHFVAKGVASSGNCFGIAVEALRAWAGTSLFSPPLSRYADFYAHEPEINVRAVSQVGADRILFIVGEALAERVHNPREVCRAIRGPIQQGRFPVLCMTEHASPFGTGDSHAVLAYALDESAEPWTVTVYDSNSPTAPNTLLVDPKENRYVLKSGDVTYAGYLTYVPSDIATCFPAPLPFLNTLVKALEMGFATLWHNLQLVQTGNLDGESMDFAGEPGDEARARFMLTPVPVVPRAPASDVRFRKAFTGSVNYQQTLRVDPAAGEDGWHYAVAFGSGELFFRGGGAPGDQVQMRFESLGGHGCRCTLASSGTGRFTAVYTAHVDDVGGQVKMVLEDLPLGPEPVQMSWKPSIEGFELIVPGGGEVPLALTHARDGQTSIRRYRVPGTGSRVRISSALTTGDLIVHPINALLGVPYGYRVLLPVA